MEPHWSVYSVGQGANLTHWQGPMSVYTVGSGGAHSSDPRIRRCGRAWVLNSAKGNMGYAPVGFPVVREEEPPPPPPGPVPHVM
eukprot:6799137-Karenia_brevis.AAC.1